MCVCVCVCYSSFSCLSGTLVEMNVLEICSGQDILCQNYSFAKENYIYQIDLIP